MPTGPHLSVRILSAREKLAEGRKTLQLQHVGGLSGAQVCSRLTALLDSVIIDLYNGILDELGPDTADMLRNQIALVPHGGYGRRHVAPYSDVDLMVLCARGRGDRVMRFAKRLTQDIFDVGLDFGHSVRTVAEACQLAKTDVTICTSLIESRLLAGQQTLFHDFSARFQQQTQRLFKKLYVEFRNARRDERHQFGETVYLLRPNIKRSRGGLRDLHLLRWIAFARFGAADPAELQRLGALSREDGRRLRNATEFLMQLRNELHFHAGQVRDVLDKPEQVRIAELHQYRGTEGLLPVEQFMREYFRHTSQVRYLVSRFMESVEPSPPVAQMFAPLLSHQIEGDYRVGRKEISATARGIEKLRTNLDEVLRLADLANLYDKRIADRTWAAVYRAASNYSAEISEPVTHRFLSLLGQPPRLGGLLRRLHDMRALEKILPAYSHARGLLQFNEYHKYTVDEHCLRAVEAATEFADQKGSLGQAYREIENKHILHLALLIHDLGKGREEDHSEAGRRIAEETADRLQLAKHDTEVLVFLVHKHLQMSHLAFRRDLSDEQLVVRFAVEVGSPEVLRMLFVLTCADLAAVGPGVLNPWKIEVLAELYARAMHQLAAQTGFADDKVIETKRAEVAAELRRLPNSQWAEEQIAALPPSLILGLKPTLLAETLVKLQPLQQQQAVAWGHYAPQRDTIEYLVGLRCDVQQPVFYRLSGALSSKGLKILSADVIPLSDDLMLDRFIVEDPDYAGEPPAERIESVSQTLVASLSDASRPKFRQRWAERNDDSEKSLTLLPTEVRVDNSTADEFTILDVFTFDRTGLLYTIARTLHELGVSIRVAKIGTYLDQVVDVFYVTDFSGAKIYDEERLETIRSKLLETIESDLEV